MSAPDVAPSASDPLQVLHQRLLARFKDELRAARATGPVFLLELELTDKELKQADRLLADALKGHPLRPEERFFWNQRYLPLLRVATEVGYLYQGTGTDYWPVLAARLGANFHDLARRELRHLFDVFAAFCEVEVQETPWAGQFPNIARPITHAILPRELHAPLLSALLASGVRRLRREDWPPLQAALLEQATRTGGRLPHFLQQETVAEAVVRALAFDEVEGAPVAEHALRRIRADVLLAERARRLLKQVVERVREVREVPPPPPPPPRTGRLCPLILVIEDERLALDVQVPASGFELSEARRRPVRLFGAGRVISVDSLLLGGREALLGVDLSVGAGGSRPLLRPEDAELIADGALRKHFVSLQVDLSAPILLAAHQGPRDTARQVRERAFAARDGYWVLSAEEPEELPRGATLRYQRVCGLCAIEVDARERAAQAWLTKMGLALTVQPRVRRLGAPPLGGRGAWETGLVAGDRLLLQVEGEAVAAKDHPVPLTPGLWRCALPEPPGSWEARLGAGGGLRLETPIRGHVPAPRPTVELSLEGAAPTLDALLQSKLFVRISSPVPLAGLRARLVLEAPDGQVAETETNPLPPLPAVIRSDDPCWATLSHALDDHGLVGIRLRVEVGAVAAETWPLPPRDTDVWGDSSSLAESPGSGETPRVGRCSPAERPLDLVIDNGAAIEGFALRVPVGEDGQEILRLARVDGPRTLVLGNLKMIPPARLLRRLEALEAERSDAVGVSRLVSALLRWSAAESAPGAATAARRLVVLALDAWVTEALCGRPWVEREGSASGLEPQLAPHVAQVLMERTLAIDEPARDHLAEQLAPMSAESRIEGALTRALAPLESALRAWQVDPNEALSITLVTRLELAVAHAYQEAARGLAPYPKDAEPDLALDPDGLTAAIVEARARWARAKSRPALLALIHPSELAQERLAPLDYDGLSVDDLAGDLVTWLKSRPARSRGWREAEVRELISLWLPMDDFPAISGVALSGALADRFAARAIRYAALRWRAARGLGGR